MSIDVERSEGPSVRDAVVDAVGAHMPSPDTDSIVSGAREDHAREVRNRDRAKPVDYYQYQADGKDRLRSAARNAYREATLKAAAPAQPARSHETPTAEAPTFLSSSTRARLNEIPEDLRLDIKRNDFQHQQALEAHVIPHLQRLAEIEKAIAPSRAAYQSFGVKSDSEAIERLFSWEHALRADPRAGIQRLAQQLGVDLRQLAGGYSQPSYQADPAYQRDLQTANQTLARFAASHPHFERVRHAMGQLIQANTKPDGSSDVTLEQAYDAVLGNTGQRAAPSHSSDRRGQGLPVRTTIKNSIAEVRQRSA